MHRSKSQNKNKTKTANGKNKSTPMAIENCVIKKMLNFKNKRCKSKVLGKIYHGNKNLHPAILSFSNQLLYKLRVELEREGS